MEEGERQLFQFVILGAISVAVWRLIDWIGAATPSPDPWGPELDAALRNDEIQATCHFCSAPLAETDWFCPGCGRSVGPYNNCSPYLYIFSFGEVLRRGTSEPFRVNWLTIAGYLVLSVEYSCLAPIYWVFLALNVSRQSQNTATEPPSA